MLIEGPERISMFVVRDGQRFELRQEFHVHLGLKDIKAW